MSDVPGSVMSQVGMGDCEPGILELQPDDLAGLRSLYGLPYTFSCGSQSDTAPTVIGCQVWPKSGLPDPEVVWTLPDGTTDDAMAFTLEVAYAGTYELSGCITSPECQAVGFERCETYSIVLGGPSPGGDDTGDDPAKGDDKGCGCATGGAPAVGWGLLPLLAFARRRGQSPAKRSEGCPS